ncbi:MAG TPA: alkaline phosphatase family protein [Candidatus Angelobacter sp.]|jgi:hypothetical protein|nr:alkaline phosphatase family protein [Candidatus Angelobacter sp.]
MAALRRRLARGAVALVLLLPLLTSMSPRVAAYSLPPIRHVWVVMLENESESATFGQGGDAKLQALAKKGTYVSSYYGIAHESLPNYIALLGGQAPTPQTQSDCQAYQDVSPATPSSDGQVTGQGCVYPASRLTVADQLTGAGLTWKGYMEDMGADSSHTGGDGGTAYPGGGQSCAHPALNSQDNTQNPTTTDRYAARHNPFVYFHSIIDNTPSCTANDVPLTAMRHDLQSVSTTPNFALISPNLCNDGHDVPCTGTDVAGNGAGGLVAINDWLDVYVPMITGSPAFRQDGMLVVTFDEGLFTSKSNTSQGDTASCCNEPTGPNTTSPGVSGPGGGLTGAVVLSPFATPGMTTTYPYNHYSLLRTVEDIFALKGGDDGHGHLGYAAVDTNGNAPYSFGSDVFTNPSGYSPGNPNTTTTSGVPGPRSPNPPQYPPNPQAAPATGAASSAAPSGTASQTLDPSGLTGATPSAPTLPGDVGTAATGAGGWPARTILLGMLAAAAAVAGVAAWRRGLLKRLSRRGGG